MNIQDTWERALKTTEIIRPRVQPLHTFEATLLSYVFLAESQVNSGDTVVRKGEIRVEKPSIMLPMNMPQFEGFEFEESLQMNEEILKSFFLVRGVSFPSMKYNNKVDSLDIFEGRLPKALGHHGNRLEREENVHTGLITGSEDIWQFSVLVFICDQVAKSADGDFRKLFEDYKRKGRMS